MNYTLHQLQVFLKVVQLQSITKASVELNMSQPAVSIQLKNLQDQFEIPLTEVIGRRLFVTDFGKEVSIIAEKIINEVYAINYKTLVYKGILAGRLKIASVSTGKYVIPYFLSDFLKQHTDIELTLDVANKGRVLESLESNSVDFALVSVLPAGINVHQEILLENKLVLVASPDTLKRKTIQKISDVVAHPIIFREEGSATRMAMEQYFGQSQVGIKKKLQLTSNEAVKQAVIAGLGFSIMPLIGISNELEQGHLQIVPLKGLPIISEWRLVWLQKKELSPVAKAYISFLQKEKQQLIEKHFTFNKKQ